MSTIKEMYSQGGYYFFYETADWVEEAEQENRATAVGRPEKVLYYHTFIEQPLTISINSHPPLLSHPVL